MKRILCQRRVSLLLTVMLLPTSVAPPGVRHIHADGDRPHSHDLIAEHDYAHGCPDHHAAECGRRRHVHRDHVGSAALDRRIGDLLPAVPHAHFWWFGLNTSLPVSSIPQDNSQGGNSSAPVVVRPFGDQVSIIQPRAELAIFLPFDRATKAFAPIVCTVARYAVTPVLGAPLCDSARHERSGVQLI